MMTPDEFDALVAEVARLNGVSAEEAEPVVVKCGDVHELDDQGRVIFEGRAWIWPQATEAGS